MRTASRLATFVLLASTVGRAAPTSAGDTPAPAEAPIPIFLQAPTDLDAFWKKLARPDFVVLDGDAYRKLRASADPSNAPATALVGSVAVSGVVEGDRAHLVVEFRLTMTADGSSWVPIQLDGLTLTEVRDATGELATRVSESRGWLVELKGSGEHLVRVELLAPVRSTVDGRRIDLAIPPSPSTRIDVVVPRTVLDASTGPNEEVAAIFREGDAGARLAARLGPRSRLELAWRERADPANTPPTLLSAQGEISLEIERGSIRSRSSWVLGAIRGLAGQITLRLDPLEELLDVEVDSRPVPVESRRDSGRSVVVIPLLEPLRPGSTRSLILNTRRPIASNGTVRVALQGYSFDQAKVQTGVIAVARTGPIFVNPSPGRGLRRIDPRTELPESLRSRPDTNLAFEFDDQPFELGLAIEPAPPRLRVESRTTITVDPRSARLQTRLDCWTSQGQVFEVRVVLPKGLEFERAGPPEVVESAVLVPLDPDGPPTPGVESPRALTLRLTPMAREKGPFAIVLEGWSAIDPSGPVALPTFRPRVDSSTGGRYAVVTERNVSAELATSGLEPAEFRVDWGLPPIEWPWPARRPGPELGLLWLRSDADGGTIPLKVTVRPRSIRHESTLSASVDRKGAEVVEEIVGEVAFGVAGRLDVAIPAEVPDRWQVEGVELAGRDLLGTDPGGSRRYRLRFAREAFDTFRLRVRYRLPFAEAPAVDRDAVLRFAPIRVLEGTSTARRLFVSAEPDLDLKADPKGWDSAAIPEVLAGSEASSPVRIALSTLDDRPAAVEIRARAAPRLALPGVVVPRVWIRTTQRPDYDLATSARLWVESREGSLAIGLPSGARWVRARVGGADLASGSVESLPGDEYRLRFPPGGSTGPVLVTVEFVVPAASTSGGWPTLRVVGEGVVQQSTWEAQVLASRAGVGTPEGWLDENEWYWAGGLWKRRPSTSPAEVWQWLTGGSNRGRSAEPLDARETLGYQSYLFSRVGPPSTLRFAVHSRITLLLACSGPVLAVGLLVLARRPRPRVIGASGLLVAFVVGSMFGPDVLILIGQSSLLGFALLACALGMNWAIERQGPRRTSGEGALIVTTTPLGSSMVRSPSPGSDDSTAIRPRTAQPSSASTADHAILVRVPPFDPLSGRDDR